MQPQPQPLKLEPLTLKSLGEGVMLENAKGPRVFIPSGRPPAAEEPPPPPTFTEADLKAAERDGFQKGFIEGIKDGRNQAESEQAAVNVEVAGLADKFAASIQPIFEHYATFAASIHAEMPRVALAIAKKVAGPALDENAHLLVADIAARACESLMNEPRLTITANDALGDTLERMLQAVASKLPDHTEIIIVRDPAMPRADCRIDWKLGSIHHTVQELWTRVDKAIENLAAVSARDGAADLKQLEQNTLGEPATDKNENKE